MDLWGNDEPTGPRVTAHFALTIPCQINLFTKRGKNTLLQKAVKSKRFGCQRRRIWSCYLTTRPWRTTVEFHVALESHVLFKTWLHSSTVQVMRHDRTLFHDLTRQSWRASSPTKLGWNNKHASDEAAHREFARTERIQYRNVDKLIDRVRNEVAMYPATRTQ